jgi:oligopeptide transport system substrate-binding protein
MTSIRMFETDETEWVRTIPVQVIDKWLGKPEVHITPFLTTYYYRFNVTKPPFDDKRVRMAFNLAVDKQAICDKILKQGQIPATTFVPPGTRGYTPPAGPGYDPEKARKLLQEAGYKVKK